MAKTIERIEKVIVFQNDEKREYAFLLGKINQREDLSDYLEDNQERLFDCLMENVGVDEATHVQIEVDKEHLGGQTASESYFVGLDAMIYKKNFVDDSGEDSIFVRGRLVCINEEKVLDILLRSKMTATLN